MICECQNCVQPKQECHFCNPNGSKDFNLCEWHYKAAQEAKAYDSPAKECGCKEYLKEFDESQGYSVNPKTPPPDRVTDPAKAVEEKLQAILIPNYSGRKEMCTLWDTEILEQELRDLVQLVRQERNKEV
jgi:hypothetical protein